MSQVAVMDAKYCNYRRHHATDANLNRIKGGNETWLMDPFDLVCIVKHKEPTIKRVVGILKSWPERLSRGA